MPFPASESDPLKFPAGFLYLFVFPGKLFCALLTLPSAVSGLPSVFPWIPCLLPHSQKTAECFFPDTAGPVPAPSGGSAPGILPAAFSSGGYNSLSAPDQTVLFHRRPGIRDFFHIDRPVLLPAGSPPVPDK